MITLSPQQVLGGLNRHEALAFTWVYNEYYPYVAGLARRLTHGSLEAEDMAQDSFAKLFGYSGRFENMDRVRRFLHSTIKNICLNHLRHQQVVSSKSDEIANLYGFDKEELPEAEIAASYISLLYQAMEKLPPQSKQVFRLWYTEELSNPEIAGQMDLSEKTVANHKSKALKFLKAEVLKMALYILLLLLLIFLK